MTIETTMQVEYGKYSYNLLVKMIRIEPSSYFFIKDLVGGKLLLTGKILELTYLDSFSLTEFGGVVRTPGISRRIISIIEKEILKNKQLWTW